MVATFQVNPEKCCSPVTAVSIIHTGNNAGDLLTQFMANWLDPSLCNRFTLTTMADGSMKIAFCQRLGDLCM